MYDSNVGLVIRRVKKPYPITVDVVEFPEFLNLTVYEDEVMEYGDEQRAAILAYLLKVRDEVQSLGIRCEIGGLPGKPPRRRVVQ